MPISIVALAIVFILGITFIITYFSAAMVFKFIKIFIRALEVSPLPYSTKKSLQEARDYAERIRTTVQQSPPNPMRDRLELTVKPVDEWLSNLSRLEQALTKLYAQQNLPRELRRATSEIERLRRQLLGANGDEVTSLQALMKSKKKHLATLNELESFQNQAELKIRKIASDLATTHTEMLLVTARGDFNNNRFQRLDENLQDNLAGLRDMLAAMDEMGYSSAATN